MTKRKGLLKIQIQMFTFVTRVVRGKGEQMNIHIAS